MFQSFRNAVLLARQRQGLYFAALLEQQHIFDAFGSASSLWQGWIYTPAVTVWVFLSQCLSPDHSCRDAVARLIAWRVSQQHRPCSADTSAYCTARDALPEEACYALVRQTAGALEAQAPTEWLWQGRRVRVVDGSTVTMPDTPANQAEYPQAKSQKPGCGFPIARILVMFSLATGAVLEAAIGKYAGKQTGESSSFRKLHDALKTGDLVLADRGFCGWCDLMLLHQRGVDLVIRKHQSRATDFRRGRRLGHDDHLVTWPKSPRPEWMSVEQYQALPDELVLRELRVVVTQRGFRPKTVIVVTTLLDPDLFAANDVTDLYRRRWQAELQLRSLKVALQMDHLRCKTPHRVRNEFYMHLVAYNLIRHMMAMGAVEKGAEPWQISFKGAMQTINQFLPLLVTGIPLDPTCSALIRSIGAHRVGNRPDRCEPRRVKRRPKQFKLLQRPRKQYKDAMK
jgi:putative transposase